AQALRITCALVMGERRVSILTDTRAGLVEISDGLAVVRAATVAAPLEQRYLRDHILLRVLALDLLLGYRRARKAVAQIAAALEQAHAEGHILLERDRKSTRLNSSHVKISYAVFCLKKKK